MPTLTELTVLATKRYRGTTAERLCYLTDGLTLPKMFDGTTLVNWGVYAPETAPSAAASSTGATQMDACEALWTPVSIVLDDCEDAWSLSGSLASTLNVVTGISTEAKVGTYAASLTIGATEIPLSSDTKLMLHCNGTDGSTTILDSSLGAKAISVVGTAQLDTAQKVFGTASLYLPIAGDYITAADSTDWDVSTGAYTFECRFRVETPSGTARVLFNTGGGFGGGSAKGVAVAIVSSGASSGISVYQNGINLGNLSYTFAAATWYTLRVSRSGTVIYVFINGVSIGTYTGAGTDLDGGTEGVSVGGHSASANFTFLGWMDEIRFDKGVALSTSTDTYTPSDTEYGEFAELSYEPEYVTGLAAYEDLSSPQDISTYYGLEFWVKSSKTLAGNDLALALYDNPSGSTELERCSIPALNAGEWTKVTYQFQEPSTLTSVASLGLIVNKDKGRNIIYLDDIRAIRCKVTLDAEYRVEGSYSVKLEIPGNVPANTLVAYNAMSTTDLHLDNVVLLSLRSNKFLGYQMFQYLLDDTAACASPLESIYLTADLEADTWNQLSLSLANANLDTAIISHGIKVVNKTVAPVTLWVDNVRRATTTAGNLTGRYYAWVSFYSTKYDRESDLSPISNVVDCQGQAISLSSIPVSTDTQVDARRIYRSQAGGTVPYLEKTISDNVTTSATLVTSDAALGMLRRHPSGEAGAGMYNPPFASPYLVPFKNTIIMGGSIPYDLGSAFVTNASATVELNSPGVVNQSMVGKEFRVSGDTQKYVIESVNVSGNTLVIRPIDNLVSGTYKGSTDLTATYQIIGDENSLHTSFIDDDNVNRYHGFPPELVQTITEGQPGDRITGLGLIGDAFIVCKQFSTHVGEGSYAPWTMSKISDSLGCAAQDTMVQDEKGNALWLTGEQGIASCDGFQVGLISDSVLDLFQGTHELGFNTAKYNEAHAVYDIQRHWLWLFLTHKDSTTNDVVLVLDRSTGDPKGWRWYYFTGIYAKSSAVIYDENGLTQIYIGDYDGFISRLWIGYCDGVQTGTLAGTATAGAASTLTDGTATFYTTGNGLKAMYITKYSITTGLYEQKKIVSNTGTIVTISGTWDANPVSGDTYWIGAYELDWKSKNFQFARATDKNMIHDLMVNHQNAASSQDIRIRVSKNLGKEAVADQTVDLYGGEEAVLLIRQRVQQAQIRVNGYSRNQAIEINTLGLRFKKRGIK